MFSALNKFSQNDRRLKNAFKILRAEADWSKHFNPKVYFKAKTKFFLIFFKLLD